jgi:hypothetical protein
MENTVSSVTSSDEIKQGLFGNLFTKEFFSGHEYVARNAQRWSCVE